ncbi:hypothetical protein ACPPVV_14145 [Rhodanobacter sp. Col0626]|uniref:hypothetical protein n=1 Tax=Rhodanobacter sp. Col0626 TaxID=3415679 RepID=UPI003CF7690B
MMFPNNHPVAPPVAPIPLDLAMSVSDENGALPHADYNLHPLVVEGLDHYMDLDDQKDRFSVR